KIAGLVVVMDPGGDPKTYDLQPLVVLTASDANAAKALEEEILPRLAGMLGPETPRPRQETIEGQRISTLPLPLMGPGQQLHYGRHAKVLVLGLQGKRVGEALNGGVKKGGLLAQPKVAAAVKGADMACALGILELGRLLPALLPKEAVGQAMVKMAV